MAQELSIYQDDSIHITNLRAILQGKTYAMANITSVSLHTKLGNKAPGVLLGILGGVLSLIGAFADESVRGCSLVFGLPMLIIGIAIAISATDTYWVRIGSASGEANALESKDRDYTMKIVNAMNQAIVQRG